MKELYKMLFKLDLMIRKIIFHKYMFYFRNNSISDNPG